MSSFRHLHDMFAAQFEPLGDGSVYRKDQKGPALPISRAEQDAFIAGYKRDLLTFMAVAVVCMFLFVGGVVYYFLQQDGEPPEALLYVGIAMIAAGTTLMSLWAWRAPARALRSRTPVGQAISNEDVQRKHLAKLGYGQLALGVAFGLGMPFLASDAPLSGWNRLWLVFAAFVVITCVVQAFRKWRLGQSGDPKL